LVDRQYLCRVCHHIHILKVLKVSVGWSRIQCNAANKKGMLQYYSTFYKLYTVKMKKRSSALSSSFIFCTFAFVGMIV